MNSSGYPSENENVSGGRENGENDATGESAWNASGARACGLALATSG